MLNSAKKDYTFLEKNKLVFRQRWPDIWEKIDNSESFESVEFVDGTPESTLCINGIHISSCYNRESEAQLQVKHISDTTSVWVYGVGTGDVILELVKNNTLKYINIILLSKSLFKESVKYFDYSIWLKDSRISITIGCNDAPIHFPFCAIPASLKFSDDETNRLRDRIQIELNTVFINAQIQDNPVFRRQILENYTLVEKDSDVSQLFHTRKNCIAYIVGAGVSLETSYEFLTDLKDHEFMIAVDGAIRPLARYLLKPDYIVAIDGQYVPISSLFDICLPIYNMVPLIYFPIVETRILRKWQGPRFAAYSNSPIYYDIKTKFPRETLFASGSVIHAAIDLAIKMGATTIKMFGVDFVFLEGATHAKKHPSRRLVDVNNLSDCLITGNSDEKGTRYKEATTPKLIAYLRDLESYISGYPNVKFINMSRRGATITGASYLND